VLAQKPGGTLKIYHRDSRASMSILEEATLSTSMPMMGVLNNLLLYDQHVAQNSLQGVVPELATGWSWSEDRKELSFTLRQGVKWRRPTLHRQRRQVHLGPLDREVERETPHQPPQGLVPERRGIGHQR
jgi:hypothetical protein